MITLDHIQAAQNKDLAALRLIIDECEPKLTALARSAASRMGERSGYVEEFTQVGRIALWEAIDRYQGDSVSGFMAYIGRTVETTLRDAARSERNPGADHDALKAFTNALSIVGEDPVRAEQYVTTGLPKGRRLSPERAYAARQAWVGAASLDATVSTADGSDDKSSYAGTLVSEYGNPDTGDVVRPKVGHGAAVEALSVLQRYAGIRLRLGSPADFADELPALVASLEDVVRVPADASARRAVLDAMAVLRSAVSTATDSELREDLRTAADDRADERAAKAGAVRFVLSGMGESQRVVLEHTFGINGAQEFGHGDRGDDEGLADAIGCDVKSVRDRRSKGLKAFAKRWIQAVAKSPQHADALAVAAAANLGRGGRK